MRKFILLGIFILTAGIFTGCGNGDSAANDINRLFKEAMPDGMGDPEDLTSEGYGTYGNDAEYEYNNNFNNVYGTAPGDFNRAGYNDGRVGNIDFDITPSNFASEPVTKK